MDNNTANGGARDRWMVGDVVTSAESYPLGGNYNVLRCGFCGARYALQAVSVEDASSRYREADVCRECNRINRLSDYRPGEATKPADVKGGA